MKLGLALVVALLGTSVSANAKPSADDDTPRVTKRKKKAKPKPKKKKPVVVEEDDEEPDPPEDEDEPVVLVHETKKKPKKAKKVVEPEAEPEVRPTRKPVEASTEVIARVTLPRRQQRHLTLAVDDGMVARRLRYKDDLATDGKSVGNYQAITNAIGVRLTARPIDEVPLEIQARGEVFVGLDGSTTSDGTQLPTRGNEVVVGVRLPLELGAARLGPVADAGRHVFTIDDDQMPAELVPDTKYMFVRAGGFAIVPVGPLRFTAAAGYRYLTSTGKLDDGTWFPRITGAGVDAELGVEVSLGRGITAFARGHVRRYFFSINPVPGDALIVGGALDQYLGAAVGLSVAFR